MTTNNNLPTTIPSQNLGNLTKVLHRLIGISLGFAWIICLAVAAVMAITIALCVFLYTTASKAASRESSRPATPVYGRENDITILSRSNHA